MLPASVRPVLECMRAEPPPSEAAEALVNEMIETFVQKVMWQRRKDIYDNWAGACQSLGAIDWVMLLGEWNLPGGW